MKNKFLKFEILSTIIIIILGIILHFTYQLSNSNSFIALFSAVNESIWEHLKLIFFPSIIMLIIGTIIFKKEYPSYLFNKTKYLFLSLFFIVSFYYTYTGIIGTHIAFLDISSFFIAIFIEQFFSYKNIQKSKTEYIFPSFLLILFLYSFFYYTYSPPQIPLFEDPITHQYGIK